MIESHSSTPAARAFRSAGIALALCTLVAPCGAQTTVSHPDGRVVAEDGFVRIEGLDGVVEVRGDWRTPAAGHVRIADFDAFLVELGGVRAADHIRLALAGDVLFDFGSAVVTEAAEHLLRRVAALIRHEALGEILVVGHTDAIGDAAANLRLSEQRAVEVIRWLHHNEGIPAGLFVGRGLGETQPVAHNALPDGRDDPAGRARNRRVELFLGTSEHADVRAAAGLVIVDSPSGQVRIDGDSVEVGGVRIDAGGVRVDGPAAGAGSAPAGTTCAAGRRCVEDCPRGDCRMICPAGAICDFGCRGGDCDLRCSAGATCDFTCAGGDCSFSCATASNCRTSCAGGGCSG